MVLLADDEPPVPVLVLDDGGDDVQRAAPGNVTDLCPGVGADRVVVGLSPAVGAVVAAEDVDPALDLVHGPAVPVYVAGVGGPGLPAGPGGGDPVDVPVARPSVVTS